MFKTDFLRKNKNQPITSEDVKKFIYPDLVNISLNIESGSFSRTTLSGSGTQTIRTIKKPKMLWFNSQYIITNVAFNSSGQSDDITQSCTSANVDASAQANNQTSVISIDDGTNAMIGVVSNIKGNSFDIIWTKITSGQDVTVKWYALTN